MNPESQDFEQLRRLFAIKRHEVPPPGYHDRFSRDVMARIRAGERGEDSRAGNWLQRLWVALESKPIFAGAFGASVCAVLISGILSAEESGAVAGVGGNSAVGNSANAFVPPGTTSVALNHGDTTALNTNTSLNSLFDIPLSAQPVNYSFSTGN
jgi:hypothetical protein